MCESREELVTYYARGLRKQASLDAKALVENVKWEKITTGSLAHRLPDITHMIG